MIDEHLEAAYEDRTHIEDAPYDGGGFPGDGSGTDDLADLMATGDEGCCDGPETDFENWNGDSEGSVGCD